MFRKLTFRSTLEGLRREAKRWLMRRGRTAANIAENRGMSIVATFLRAAVARSGP